MGAAGASRTVMAASAIAAMMSEVIGSFLIRSPSIVPKQRFWCKRGQRRYAEAFHPLRPSFMPVPAPIHLSVTNLDVDDRARARTAPAPCASRHATALHTIQIGCRHQPRHHQPRFGGGASHLESVCSALAGRIRSPVARHATAHSNATRSEQTRTLSPIHRGAASFVIRTPRPPRQNSVVQGGEPQEFVFTRRRKPSTAATKIQTRNNGINTGSRNGNANQAASKAAITNTPRAISPDPAIFQLGSWVRASARNRSRSCR